MKWWPSLQTWESLFVIGGVILFVFQSRELIRTNNLALTAQRAWVGPIRQDLETWKPGEPIRITHVISNSGATPALEITARGRWALQPPEWVFRADYSNSATRRLGFLLPNAETTWPVSVPVTDTNVADLKAGTMVLYLYGELTYFDATREQSRHTFFCYRLNRDSSVSMCENDYSRAD